MKRIHILTVFLFVFLLSAVAFAQALPPPVANNPNPASLVSWSAFGYMLIAFIVSVLTPNNTFLPFVVSTKARALIATAGGVLETILLAIYTATPWQQALLAGAVSAFAAFATHGARTLPGASTNEAVQQKSGRPAPVVPAVVEEKLPTPPAVPK